MEQEVKKQVAPILLKMELGEIEEYPSDRLDYINTAIQRLQTKFYKKGLKWSAVKSDDKESIIVKRIS